MAYKVTKDVINDIQKHASRGLTKAQIAAAMGWSGKTLYNKIKEDLRVLQAIKKGQALGIQQVANALFINATEHNNTTAQIFFLKNRAQDEWKDRMPEGGPSDSPIPDSYTVKIVDARKTD